MSTKTGVFPCYENQFQIGEIEASLNNIADMETFSMKLDNGVEEWSPYGENGWIKRLMTSKSITISVAGKRNFGDEGNDFVASKFLENGINSQGYFQWTFPDGAKLLFANAIINITNMHIGKSTEIGPLEFDVMSNGKPTYTAAPVA